MKMIRSKIYSNLAALLVLVALVSTAEAQVVTSFRWWNTTANSLTDNLGTGIAAGNATILTFLTPDSSANPAAVLSSFDSWADVDAALGGSIYAVRGNAGPDRFTTTLMQEEQPNNFAIGQYAWALVLELPVANFTTLAALDPSTYYGTAGVSPSINNLDTPLPGTAQSFGGFTVQTLQQIPEPSAMALMGLGGLLMAIRRRRMIA
jgi:hypothetical protein